MLEIKTLLFGSNDENFFRFVFFIAIDLSGEVAGGIERGAIGFFDQVAIEIEVCEINHGWAIGSVTRNFLFEERFDDCFHIRCVKTFSMPEIKNDVEFLVAFFEIFDAGLPKLFPEGEVMFIAIFHFFEDFASFVVNGWVGLSGFVYFHIEIKEMCSGGFGKCFIIAPESVGEDDEAILLTPIPEPIFGRDFIALGKKEIVKSPAKERVAKMTNMEGFGNIRATVFEKNLFIRLFAGAKIFTRFFEIGE